MLFFKFCIEDLREDSWIISFFGYNINKPCCYSTESAIYSSPDVFGAYKDFYESPENYSFVRI